jgi:hypothetical protein
LDAARAWLRTYKHQPARKNIGIDLVKRQVGAKPNLPPVLPKAGNAEVSH